MIFVSVTVDLLPGCRRLYLEAALELAEESRLEAGCLEYEVTAEVPLPPALAAALPPESNGVIKGDRFVVVERWDDLDAYERHFSQPHFQACVRKMSNMVRSVEVQILQPAESLPPARRDRALPR
jgi:quinol monooxygenase YgiN